MKRILSQIWKDLSHGKHIIDYVLILVAFVLPVLNIFKLVSTERIIWATLPILGLLAAKAVSNTWRETGEIRIHENWTGEVYEAFAKARKSIVVLTSWVIDAATLADKISTACEKTNKTLDVDIYMLDPGKPFGAQRYGEIHEAGKDQDWYQDPHCKDWYRTTFETAVKTFKHRLNKTKNVRLKFRMYATMPHVKICVIDDETFFFSWLPADEASTKNACFELSDKSADDDVRYAIGKLREHLKALSGQSTTFES